MTSAKFASLHGDLLARKGRATPATGEVNAVRAHSFDTEMPTLEPESHTEKEIPAMIAAAPETEERIHEVEDAQLAPLVVEPEVVIEQRQFDQGSSLEQPERHASEPRNGIERRRPPVFGKRGATRAPLSEMSQKRFNA